MGSSETLLVPEERTTGSISMLNGAEDKSAILVSKNNPEISVIVSTFKTNAFPCLLEIIKSLSNQGSFNIELVIVIDENVDLFYQLGEQRKNNTKIDIKLIFNEKNQGLSYSRNMGILHSTGNIVAFIDDDAVPRQKWVSSIIDTFSDPQVGGFAGEVIPEFETQNCGWFPRELFWIISCSYTLTPTTKIEIDRGFGVNMAFRRLLLQKVGMFDTSLGLVQGKWIGGEDTDVFLKIKANGFKIMFNPEAVVIHKIPNNRINPLKIVRRAFNGGTSIARFKKMRKYSMVQSKEQSYLEYLITNYYPHAFMELIKSPSRIKMMSTFLVSLALTFESVGYICGMLSYPMSKVGKTAHISGGLD